MLKYENPMKIILKFLSVFLLIILIFFLYLIFPVPISDEEIIFVVPLDPNQENIINELKEKGFIRSRTFFSLAALVIHFPGKIEPGSYKLKKKMNIFQTADTLLNHPYQTWVVLVPGLRVEQTAEKLAQKMKWNRTQTQEYLENAREGYMFPDTYLLNIDYTPKETAQRLISNFNEKFDAQLQNDLLSRNIRNDTAIKIASLIERESGGDEDKTLIAGIIWNRLNTGMRLQIDATAQYILGKSGNWWPIVRPADLKIPSPYNSYQNDGLPPTPICNPGLASIKAAAYSEETECLFYLHDKNKNIHCAVTYEEHLENIDRYLRD